MVPVAAIAKIGPCMSVLDAERLTERIRLTAHNYRQKLQELVTEAKEGNAHLALGYASWTAYLADVLGEEPMRLARGERQEMVQMLSAEGMSTRAIAPIVGASREQVRRDMAPDTNVSPEPTASVQGMDGKTVERDVRGGTNVPPIPVQGMDGKTYTRPEPAEPAKRRRRPITDQAHDIGWELRKVIERLGRLRADDRYPRQTAEVEQRLRGHIQYALSVLTSDDGDPEK